MQSTEDSTQTEPARSTKGISSSAEEETREPVQTTDRFARIPKWVGITPFFLSAFLFLSAFFNIFAPLPILFLHVRKGRSWGWFAALTNAAVVGAARGAISLVFYVVFVLVIALMLPELLKRKKSIEKSIGWTLVGMGISAVVFMMIYSRIHHVNPIHEIRSQISSFIEYLTQSWMAGSDLVSQGDMEGRKETLLLEFPSALAIFSLVLVWANAVILLKFNLNGIRESVGLDSGFLKKWKAPEYLVWPTILAGFFLVIDLGSASIVALNIFNFLMAIYALQGLSIISFFFDLWNIRGIFRWTGYLLSVFLMTPLVLSLGFFDLWFDFRNKFRQS